MSESSVHLTNILKLKSVYGCNTIKTTKELTPYTNDALDHSLSALGYKLNELVTGPDCQVYEKSIIMVQHTNQGFRYTDKILSPNFDVGLLNWKEVITTSDVVHLMVEFYIKYLGPNYLDFK